jgi:Trk-type K+ transport system membrane component
MILKPRFEDLKAIGFYLGKITLGLAFTMLIPVLTGLFYGETDPAADFVIGIEISVLLGLTLQRLCRTDKDLNWMQGMIVVSLSWFVAMFLGAIPLYLSGTGNLISMPVLRQCRVLPQPD